MASKPISVVDYRLERALKEKLESLGQTLQDGAATDFAAYQYLCGQIRGIRFAMDTLIESREKSVRDEDWDQ